MRPACLLWRIPPQDAVVDRERAPAMFGRQAVADVVVVGCDADAVVVGCGGGVVGGRGCGGGGVVMVVVVMRMDTKYPQKNTN